MSQKENMRNKLFSERLNVEIAKTTRNEAIQKIAEKRLEDAKNAYEQLVQKERNERK